jgi:hypothetical protein
VQAMCFSPQADLVGGAVIGAIGLDALRHVQRRRDMLALAALPLVLGVHQLIESIVWWGLKGDVPHRLGSVALWAYLLIAFVLLPILVPVAVLWSEPTKRRQLLMAPFVAIGVVVAGLLLTAMLRGPVTVQLRPYHLSYGIQLKDSLPVIALYVTAVCGALLCSGHRHVVMFGAVNLVAIGVIAWLTVDGFASVWCGWAAVTAGFIAAKMRWTEPTRSAHVALA